MVQSEAQKRAKAIYYAKLKEDEAIDVFRKSMIQKYEGIDPSPNIVYTVERYRKYGY